MKWNATLALILIMIAGCSGLSGSPDGLKVSITKVAVGSRVAWTISDTCTGNPLDSNNFCNQDEVTDIKVTFEPEGILVSHGLLAHEPGAKYKKLVVEALRQGTVTAQFSGRISGNVHYLNETVRAVVPNAVSTDFCHGREVLVSTSPSILLNSIMMHDGDVVPWVGVKEMGRIKPIHWEPAEALTVGSSADSVAPTDFIGPAALKSVFDPAWSLEFMVIDPFRIDGVILTGASDGNVQFQAEQLPRNLNLRPIYTSQGKAVCGTETMRVLVRSLSPEICHPKGQGESEEVEFRGFDPAMTIVGFGECLLEFEPISDGGSNRIEAQFRIEEAL